MSPILGIYASQISGHLTPPSNFESIATLSGTGSSASITFSSIPSGYTHLQIRGISAQSYSSIDFGGCGIRFNGDTSTNYSRHQIVGFRSAGVDYAQAGGIANTTFTNAGISYLRSSGNVIVGASIIDILDYNNTNKNKTVRGFAGAQWTTAGGIFLGSGAWRSTASVTSITVFGQNGNFGTETSFALYGIKE